MSRKINRDNIEEWYDPYKLKALFLYRGYDDYASVVSRVLNVSKATAPAKINRCILSHSDTIELAKALKMTPSEYCDVFMRGVFYPVEEKNSDV